MTPVLTVRKTLVLVSKELMRRKLMISSLLPDLENMISTPSLVRKLALLGLRYLEERSARTKKSR